MNCNDCVLRDKSPDGKCYIFHQDMTDGPGCPSFTNHLTQCSICGNYIAGAAPIVETDENGNGHSICANCAQATFCQICANGGQCLFETSPDPLPKVVFATQRQGAAVIQTQVRNPERIKKLCPECICYVDGECCKNHLCCNNFKIHWRN